MVDEPLPEPEGVAMLEDSDIEEITSNRAKIEIFFAEELNSTVYGLLDADAMGAVDAVRQKAQTFLSAGDFKKESIAQLQSELGSQDWKDAIPDAGIRDKLGMLLSAEIKDKILEKIQEKKSEEPKPKKEKTAPDWRDPDAYPVPEGEQSSLGEAEEALEESSGSSAEFPTSAIAGAEESQARFSEKMENIKDGIVEKATYVKDAIVQDSRGENRQKRLAFINKQKSLWTRIRMRMGFINPKEQAEYANNQSNL